MTKKFLGLFILIILSKTGLSQQKAAWVDSVFQTLNTEEKIAQLFMLTTPSDDALRLRNAIASVKSHTLGGIIFTSGGPTSLRSASVQMVQPKKVLPLVGWDAPVTPFSDSLWLLPTPLQLGAVDNDSLLQAAASLHAQTLKSSGISLNFTSDVKLSGGAAGDTLYTFWGDDPRIVSNKLSTYVRALREQHVLSCAKNFILPQSPQRSNRGTSPPAILSSTDSLHFSMYRKLMDDSIAGLLPSHVQLPVALERKAMIRKIGFLPSALSNVLANVQLQQSFAYAGLLFANVPEVKLSSGKIRWGEPELFAFQAGNDVLINPQNIPQAIRKIKAAVKREKIYQEQLDKSVRKILMAKYDADLYRKATQSISYAEIQKKAALLNQQLYEASITVVKNNDEILPLKILDNSRFASLAVGEQQPSLFGKSLNKFALFDSYSLNKVEDTLALSDCFNQYTTVVVGLFPFGGSWQKGVVPFLKRIRQHATVILINFSTPERLQSLEDFPAIVQAYTDKSYAMETIAQVVFGPLCSVGKLPVAASTFPSGTQHKTGSLQRMGYTLPERAGMDSKTLEKIKDVAYEAINAGATPGCHVLVARKGKIVYQRSFGWTAYDNKIPVTDETIYDLASVTKVSATLQTTAFLYEKGLIDINKKMSVYLPELKGTNKEDFIIKDILTHQSGLWPFLPFWAQTLKDSVFMQEFYSTASSANYPFPVAENLFASSSMKDSLWHWIINSKVREKPVRTPYDYRYSDMGFYMLQRLADRLLNQPMEDFLYQNLYDPLGAGSLGYQPLNRYSCVTIAPTEKDTLFRKSLLIGHVHDQGAAMHGGVAGHAGLFGNATDLAKIGQLWLNKGTYAGLQYLKPETVDFFTRKQYENSRRGLGWDKRDFINEAISPTSKYSSDNTFGHTGFTGTCIWVDPDYDLVYVFLSNRVHPDMNNNKLLSMSIRTRIHDLVYESIFNYK
jgi:CubicO group peptidase (beta-lactamase class C family)/beta-glucosidase-like glycosyl hydrolase